jgi:hypothetical protein
MNTNFCETVQRDRIYYLCFACASLDLLVTLFCQYLFFKFLIINYLCVHDSVHGREREHFSRRLLKNGSTSSQ